MTRVKITKANEANELHVDCNGQSAVIPIDGEFHDIHPDLLPALEDSAAEFEIEAKAAPAKAPTKPKAPAKPKAKKPAAKAASTKRQGASRESAKAGGAS